MSQCLSRMLPVLKSLAIVFWYTFPFLKNDFLWEFLVKFCRLKSLSRVFCLLRSSRTVWKTISWTPLWNLIGVLTVLSAESDDLCTLCFAFGFINLILTCLVNSKESRQAYLLAKLSRTSGQKSTQNCSCLYSCARLLGWFMSW